MFSINLNCMGSIPSGAPNHHFVRLNPMGWSLGRKPTPINPDRKKHDRRKTRNRRKHGKLLSAQCGWIRGAEQRIDRLAVINTKIDHKNTFKDIAFIREERNGKENASFNSGLATHLCRHPALYFFGKISHFELPLCVTIAVDSDTRRCQPELDITNSPPEFHPHFNKRRDSDSTKHVEIEEAADRILWHKKGNVQ